MDKIKDKLKNITEKQIAIAGAFLILIVAIIVIINMKFTRADPTTAKIGIDEEVVIDSLTITNGSISYNNGISTFTAKITNTGSDYNLKNITITLYDNDNKVIGTLMGYVGSTIGQNQVRNITSSIDTDVTAATSIVYTINK